MFSDQNAGRAFVKKDVLMRLAGGKLFAPDFRVADFGSAGCEMTIMGSVGQEQVLRETAVFLRDFLALRIVELPALQLVLSQK